MNLVIEVKSAVIKMTGYEDADVLNYVLVKVLNSYIREIVIATVLKDGKIYTVELLNTTIGLQVRCVLEYTPRSSGDRATHS